MKTIIANWKMHLGIRESLAQARGVLRFIMGNEILPEIVLCPSFTALSEVRKVLVRTRVALGGQTTGTERFGAFTGDISVAQLDDVGCTFVIIGHSERRAMNGETDDVVNAKMKLVAQTSIVPVLCVGESVPDRESGMAESTVAAQLVMALRNVEFARSSRLLVAYEPVWAIGSGKSARISDVVAMHGIIRKTLEELLKNMHVDVQILYGGSVSGENAYQFLREPEIDGVLVGGASLKIQEFEAIIFAARDVMIAQNV
ncbi:MAG: triose-phosphate isomerase [Patescibacteria group bacterium]|jgi:triosephosphate isomerase